MRTPWLLSASLLVLSTCTIFGQKGHPPGGLLPFLAPDSQTNLVVIVDGHMNPQPPPLEYTNLLSNTNLFSSAERILLQQLPAKYQFVTTNLGPTGTIFAGLSNSPAGVVASFQHTNSDAYEQITFGAVVLARFRTASGDGYDLKIYRAAAGQPVALDFQAVRHNVLDGLLVKVSGTRCMWWMRFEGGKAVGRWLIWTLDGKLFLEAVFTQPYDYFANERLSGRRWGPR